MKKEPLLQTEKEQLRTFLIERRKSLSVERRVGAKEALNKHLLSICAPFPYILSFDSFKNEIDLSALNRELRLQKKLLLPKVEGENLIIFHTDGTLFDPKKIPCIIVPGLGFDLQCYRIGYGKGHYDRFLKETPTAFKLGIGFREQFVNTLPREEHDQRLNQVLFF